MIWLQALLSDVVTAGFLWRQSAKEMNDIRYRSELTDPPLHQVLTQERKHGHGPQASEPPCFLHVAPDVAVSCMKWPESCIITWQKYHPRESNDFTVHAKAAIADRNKAFLTSANLTGHALNKNIEVGPLLTGGYPKSDFFFM